MTGSSSPSDDDRRVVPLRPRSGPGRSQPPSPDMAEDGLSAYSRSPEDPAEYRHRMAVNAGALLFVVVLIGIALWLANAISDMRRNQDCVLSGRRGCTPVEYDPTAR